MWTTERFDSPCTNGRIMNHTLSLYLIYKPFVNAFSH